jgi:hypothetical protein
MPGKYATSYNARQLFAEWLSHGLIDADQQARLEQFSTTRKHEPGLPLYSHVLVGIGALIALSCFIGFLTITEIIKFDSSPGLIGWGIFFILGAILLEMVPIDRDNAIRHSFLMQASFCLMATGKILLVTGIALQFSPREEWGIAVGALLVTALVYFVYPMSIDRFLSALAVLISIFVNVLMTRFDAGTQAMLLNAFFVAQLSIAAILMTNGRISQRYVPIAYALIASLCVEVVFFANQTQIGYWGHRYDFSPAIINISLTATLIALIGWAAGGIEKLKSEALAVAALGAVCLGVISAPGILLAVGLMTLGYAKHERLLLFSGALLFPVFLSLYYYNLDVTLMAKSGILVGSGAVLLAGRAYMHYRGFDREI